MFVLYIDLYSIYCRGREEALYQLRCQQNSPDKDHPWIIVDSDGEEVSYQMLPYTLVT